MDVKRFVRIGRPGYKGIVHAGTTKYMHRYSNLYCSSNTVHCYSLSPGPPRSKMYIII